jgi:signal transduction histidine kinase
MPGPGAPSTSSAEAAFISEVFHTLSQPLTVLHCTLDLALQRDRTLEQLRASVQIALDNAERLRQRLLLVRALNDADTPAQEVEATDLCDLLRQLREDMAPLFESTGHQIRLQIGCVSLPVQAGRQRLMRSLFVFVEYLYRYLREGGLLFIELTKAEGAEVHVAAEVALPVSAPTTGGGANQACEIELLRRTVVTAGGEFTALGPRRGASTWLFRFPFAQL